MSTGEHNQLSFSKFVWIFFPLLQFHQPLPDVLSDENLHSIYLSKNMLLLRHCQGILCEWVQASISSWASVSLFGVFSHFYNFTNHYQMFYQMKTYIAFIYLRTRCSFIIVKWFWVNEFRRAYPAELLKVCFKSFPTSTITPTITRCFIRWKPT